MNTDDTDLAGEGGVISGSSWTSLTQRIWIVGDWKHADFGEAVAWLKTRARCFLFDDAPDALSSLRAAESVHVPTAIVLAQSRPGQISRGNVERLRAAAPLARLVRLVGAWCEGEGRSESHSSGVVRVPVIAWRCRLEQELGFADNRPGKTAPMPRTVTAAERIESNLTTVQRNR